MKSRALHFEDFKGIFIPLHIFILLQTVFNDFTGEVWSTYSYISGFFFGTIFGADMGNYTMTVSPSEAGYGTEVNIEILKLE